MKWLFLALALWSGAAVAQQGLPSNPANPSSLNAWTINLPNQVFYFEGSSITRAPHSGGAAVGSQLPGGGLSGNYGYLLATSPWGAGHGTYYNDGVDGSTSTQMLARYTTGNSTYGVTVPSAHSVCAAATAAGNRAFFFVDTTAINNDQLNSISLATSLSNYQTLYADAHADGCTVVMLATPGQNFSAGESINQDIRYGSLGGGIPADKVIDLEPTLPDQTDTTFWSVSHPTPAGHQLLAANIVRAMTSNGDYVVGNLGVFSTLKINGTLMSNAPLMLFSTYLDCGFQYNYCSESPQWAPSFPILITKFQLFLSNAGVGCTTPGTFVIQNGSGTPYNTITLANGTASYTNSGLSIQIGVGGLVQFNIGSTAAAGCSTYPNGAYALIEYRMQ